MRGGAARALSHRRCPSFHRPSIRGLARFPNLALVSRHRSNLPEEPPMIKRIIAIAAAALALGATSARAQEVKVGIALPYTGIGAEFAQLVDRGMELYLKLNPDKVKPYKFTLIRRDVNDPSGAHAKIAVQELLTQDNVDVLAGCVYSPNAIASAPVVSAGKKLAVIMNAGTAHITNLSPFYVRTSFSMWHAGYALGEASARILNAKTAVVGYTDFP